MERITQTPKKRLTILSVARDLEISSRRVICRAGRMVLKRLRDEGKDQFIISINQDEIWRKKKRTYRVASYPSHCKPLIVQMLTASEIIQNNVDKN